jgi:membrane associated rhomboid family serine protease
MITMYFFGNAIRVQYGGKYLTWLYLSGAIGGSIFMSLFMPYQPVVMPQVGADSATAAIITFYGIMNRSQTVLLFFIPMKLWVLVGLMGAYSLLADPSKRNLGGMIAGMSVYMAFRGRLL